MQDPSLSSSPESSTMKLLSLPLRLRALPCPCRCARPLGPGSCWGGGWWRSVCLCARVVCVCLCVCVGGWGDCMGVCPSRESLEIFPKRTSVSTSRTDSVRHTHTHTGTAYQQSRGGGGGESLAHLVTLVGNLCIVVFGRQTPSEHTAAARLSRNGPVSVPYGRRRRGGGREITPWIHAWKRQSRVSDFSVWDEDAPSKSTPE